MFFTLEFEALNQSATSSQDQPDSTFDRSQSGAADTAKSKALFCTSCHVIDMYIVLCALVITSSDCVRFIVHIWFGTY